uniref:ATPase family AAA domain-containing protein 5 n=1 Tax=Aceria tosichella TaxID=561515 RepID=A0A6G1SG33_9ACAR
MWPPSTNTITTTTTTTIITPIPQLQQQQQQRQSSPPDLLAHKYRPTSVETIGCHREQAKRLRQWILEFTNAPRNDSRHGNGGSSSDSDYDECGHASDDSGAEDQSARRCVLITGPPGIGKTSLVYMIANELRMHIVESHPSEKRDFKLFKTLKLANQKGKINPIAKLFQMTQQKPTNQPQGQRTRNPRVKRRKLEQTTNGTSNGGDQKEVKNTGLSLSGDSSIVLFDDVDVVFEEDGPFLKSLAEFIRDSKRPVIVTATRFIENIKSNLVHFEHIQLNRPPLDDCVRILRDICRKEKYYKLDKMTNCRIIAKRFNCDIRQCLNMIHFYGEKASYFIESDTNDIQDITPNFSRLSGHLEYLKALKEDDEKTDIEEGPDDDEATIILAPPTAYPHDVTPTTLSCYDTISLIDLMDSTFDFANRAALLNRWLDGKPSDRARDQSCGHELGEEIRKSIVELTHNLYRRDLTTNDEQPKSSTATPTCCFNDLKASLGTNYTPLPIASRLRLRPRHDTRRSVVSPFLSATIETLDSY